MAFPKKYCCNHRWEDAARGRNIQQVIVHDLISSQLLRLEVVFSHVGMYWDVGICFAAGSYLVKILLLFRIVSHFEATIWAVRIKGLMFQNQDHQNPTVKAHLVQRFRGPCFDPCMSLFVHVSCLFAILALGPHPVPAPTKSSSRSVVSNYISRSDVSVHWLVWHHYN